MDYMINRNLFKNWTFQNAMKKGHRTIVLDPMHLDKELVSDGMKKTENSFSIERICTTTMKTRKRLSICESLPRLDLVTSRAVSYKSADTTIPGRALQLIDSCFKTCEHNPRRAAKTLNSQLGPSSFGLIPVCQGLVFSTCVRKTPERWDRSPDPRTDRRGRRRPTSHYNVPGMLYTLKI